jgi:hypothetical protein
VREMQVAYPASQLSLIYRTVHPYYQGRPSRLPAGGIVPQTQEGELAMGCRKEISSMNRTRMKIHGPSFRSALSRGAEFFPSPAPQTRLSIMLRLRFEY